MSRVTLKDIAELAGVSTAAISQALNDRGNLRPETRDRIKAVAAELGYIDEVILPEETRPKIINALEMLATKRDTNPPKKHGNVPL